jgi:hypothetical protein
MEASVQLPDALVSRLERLAEQEGTSVPGLIQRLVAEHVEHTDPIASRKRDAHLPLIPREKTGVILPVTGADLDEMFAREDLTS